METKAEKVYVAIGRDAYDGFATLQWALRKWSGHGVTIVILHGAYGFSKDYVYTPLGKLHVNSVSEEKLKALEKDEEAKIDKILSQYIACCAKVKVEVIKLEKNEQQPLHKQIVDIISNLRITKLVMSFAFLKSSSWKSRTAISGSFYILRHKPEFCELFVICGGRLVSLRDENHEGFIEDDRGVMVAKIKERSHSIKTWLGKMFPENAAPDSPSSSKTNSSVNQWIKSSREIEQYANELMSLYEEEGQIVELENVALKELHIPENMDAGERLEVIQCQIRNAEDAIQSNKKQANAAKERGEKARWALSICNARAEELETSINLEVVKNANLCKELDSRKVEITELGIEVEEKRRKLNSILELQKELSDKLRLSSSAKARAEAQLEKAVRSRADMVQEIEELRKHRDVLKRRIEFCKEKDAIGKASKLNGFGFNFREFYAPEIVAATEDFSERLRLKSTGHWTNIYKGRLNHITVAIKVYDQANEDFANKVKLLSQLRHPNIVAMIGFCSELNCMVYEYMHNKSLHDVLLSTKRTNRTLDWHTRIRIASEVCSGLAFLHNARPKPIIHGNLQPSHILLDRYQVAKINGLKGPYLNDEHNIALDIQAFGSVLVKLLTGKTWEAKMGTNAGNGEFLDHLDVEWPMDLAMELYGIAMRCLSTVKETVTAMPTVEINDVKKRANELLAKGEYSLPLHTKEVDESSNVPSSFVCPIYQDVMKNPHLAADGFSYEFEAIDAWLRSGHDTSPMTNLKLKHKFLTPNIILKSLIQDWQIKRSASPSP